MATSYNGWPASRNPADIAVRPFEVAGRDFPGGVRSGGVATVLKYVAAQMHVRVESLYTGTDKDDWGYSYRANVNNPSQLSCHSSGTAIDINATEHPNGKRNTFTAAQVVEIRRILKEVDGLVRWGGDFTTKDEMHFEIHGTKAQIDALAKRLVNPAWFKRELRVGDEGLDVVMVRKRLKLNAGTVYTPGVGDAVNRFRLKLQLPKGTAVTKGLAYFIGAP